MKSLSLAVVSVLLACWFCAAPAEAVCETCVYHGYYCGSFGCEESWLCESAGSPCSQCYENCSEVSGFYCNLSMPCQFAEKPAENEVLLCSHPSSPTSEFPAS